MRNVNFRDGQLKRMKAKEIWKTNSQRDYSKLLKLDTLQATGDSGDNIDR